MDESGVRLPVGPQNLMRKIVVVWFLVAVAVIVAGFFALNKYIYNEKQGTETENYMSQTPVEVIPIEHATFVLRWGNTIFYFDPVGGAEAFAGQPAADVVLVTDIHGDHFNIDTLNAVLAEETTLIVPRAVFDELPGNLSSRASVMANGGNMTIQGLRIEAVPMYNLPDAENANFHVKGRGNGYLIEKDGFRVYNAGDTAGTPEMRALANIDIAFVPMNLPYTMSVEEAANAVLAFKPKMVYPFHYRQPDGLADAARFKSLVEAGNSDIKVVLAEWYPTR